MPTMHKSHLQMVEDYVQSILKEKTPAQNAYHNLEHTQDVVQSAIEIGIGERLTPDKMEIIQTAAWFHDTGYIEKIEDHEELSAMFASNFLYEENYPPEKIEIIVSCILATKVPTKPNDHLQEIICDADLNHFGRKTFFERNDRFRIEVQNYSNHNITEYEWLTKTINFFTRHRFYTDYALKNFSEQKEENLRILQEQLDKVLSQSK